MNRAPITVVIPSIPPRSGPGGLLAQSVESVRNQLLTPTGGCSVSLDVDRVGPAVTRQRALDAVRTSWVAYLDDDDLWYQQHLQVLYQLAVDHDADYAYSWFDGNNPFPGHRGKQMDPKMPHHTTMNILVKTELSKSVGFCNWEGDGTARGWSGEDWTHQMGCIRAGAKFIGTDEITWHYRLHSGNTSGLTDRW